MIRSSVIEAPFRCVCYRSHFSYKLLPVRSTTSAMRRQDRLAIQRRVILRPGSEIEPAGVQWAIARNVMTPAR
jgi:hypothetical protein